MGLAKAAMMEEQERREVAEALDIEPDELDGHGYQIEDFGSGARIVWDYDAPEGVEAHIENGRLVSVVDFPDHLDGPDDE